jgi:CheY-like chemotaxis protein
MQPENIDASRIEFSHTAFNQLMQRRVFRVLLVCSNYDFFMLEEDGRIDEQIFNEYTSLNIRFPPALIQADSAKKAFEILNNNVIDLVILMLNIGDIEPFGLAHQIKQQNPEIPIVVLTNFSREVSIRLQNEDLSAIDYVFCWLGNADLLLAIIKLIEDRMNTECDVLQIGVQTILLVEDSVRYISQILPLLYKIIIRQSQDFMQEGLNEHQKMLRLRGRPKILLAKTYVEAIGLYQKYGQHMLGIISDISFKKTEKLTIETPEGLELCKFIKSEDTHMPFLLQSSDISNREKAMGLKAGFVHKLSKSLSHDLQQYVINNFGFGPLHFIDPETQTVAFTVSDLADLQHKILKIPNHIFDLHARRNEISKWLNARALFSIGELFKTLKIEDFENHDKLKAYIYDAIANYRMSKSHGVIAAFDKKSFDESLTFSRIGDGSLGGKGRGLAFIDMIIKKHNLFNRFQDVNITIPRTVVITTDLFDEFMEMNDLYKIGLSDALDDEILQQFVKASLPARLLSDLKSFTESIDKPIAIRSSSKLEDSYYQPFAGIYTTYMVPLIANNTNKTIQLISEAIKCVYASVYFKESKSYIASTSNIIDEEKMGIILEEVCGRQYNNLYYPALSGVARSINFYPIKPETSLDGVANIAFGLGKYIVEGGDGLRFSPKFPSKILQLATPEMALKETQKYFYALNLNPNEWKPSVDDKINLQKLNIIEALNDSSLFYAASDYDFENNCITDNSIENGKKIITFSKILNHKLFPLANILQTILEIGQKEMNTPIEIEFAADLDQPKGDPKNFFFLQIRPIVGNDQNEQIEIKEHEKNDAIVFSKNTLGNGIFHNIQDFVYVRPETFNPSESMNIVQEIEDWNIHMRSEKRNYILAGPGRWGSTDPWLGIPIKWAQITEARIIIEAGLENYRIEPSQGTHFFQNLTSFRVGYMTINSYIHEGKYNIEFLNNQQNRIDKKYISIVHFSNPLLIKIDGRQNFGVIIN